MFMCIINCLKHLFFVDVDDTNQSIEYSKRPTSFKMDDDVHLKGKTIIISRVCTTCKKNNMNICDHLEHINPPWL